jgi:hypothetical protein
MTRVPGVVLVLCLVASGACFNPTFHDPKCGPGGACPTGFACFDGTCRSNLVDDASVDDADVDAPDAPNDALMPCLGSGAWQLCVTGAMPASMVSLTGSINTDTSSLCSSAVAWTSITQPDACVIPGASIAITGNTSATGSRPLVLFSLGTITQGTNIALDVASHRAGTTGAGTQPAVCAAFPQAPMNSAAGAGGGAGGSFMNMGGGGGAGGNGSTPGLAPAADTTAPTVLRGGCRGQTGAEAATGSAGAFGAGGGAVYLLARTSISLAGPISASGAGGSGALTAGGGGGGGAGGMIVLSAPSITSSTARLVANGGGGGGAGGANNGMGGFDPNPNTLSTAAPGGSGGAGNGCGGQGMGGSGAATTVVAGVGEAGSTNNTCGGGGGGGAIGYIRSSVVISGITSSPTISVVP